MRKRTELTHPEVVALLKAKQGERSLRQFAEEMGISAAYLSDVFLGRRAVGPTILKQLGLEKNVITTVTYTREKDCLTA